MIQKGKGREIAPFLFSDSEFDETTIRLRRS